MAESKETDFKIVKFESPIYLKQTVLEQNLVFTLEKIKLEKHKLNENNFFNKDANDSDKTKLVLDFIKPHIYQIINREFKLNDWWIQKYKKQNYHDLHTHGHEHNRFSFILYLKSTTNSAKTVFYGPGHPLIYWQGFEVKPMPGLLILFPSYIPHSVGYNEDDERLILSGNIEV